MRKFFRRVHFLLSRRRLERELADEMEAHREMLPAERRTAFGDSLRLREDARDAWAWIWLDRLWQDLSYATRMFRHSPVFTLGAITVLALGVGANLAEFHIFDALLLHRLNFEGADQVYRLARNTKDERAQNFPHAAIEFYRQNCTLCAYVVSENTSVSLIVESDSDQRANFVPGNYFSSVRILPAWGRLLDERDSQPGAPAVAVLGYEYFRNVRGADPHVVNQTVHINGKPVQIVGVVPYDFDGLSTHSTTVWLPAAQRPFIVAGSPPLDSLARADEDLYVRLKPRVSLSAVEAQLTTLTRDLARREPAYFHTDERIVGDHLPGSGLRLKKLNPAVLLMVIMVLLVLLSACANLGNMLVARGLARQKEIDIRIALGAGRRRVVRQLLTENLFLAALGAGAGLLVGDVSARLLIRALDAPPDIRITMDWQIVVAGAVFAFLSLLAFGLPPALQLARGNHKSGLRRQALVAVQVAVSCLLLIASALFTRSAIRSATIDLAFDYRNMVVVYPQLYTQHLSPAISVQKLDALRTRLEALPGTAGITYAINPPLGHRYRTDTLPGLPPILMNYVAPSYFAVMNIPVLRGRSFVPGDRDAVVVSKSAARAAWPNQDPIGKTWNIESANRTVIGVAKDSGANLIVDSESVEAYLPVDPHSADRAALILRAKGEPSPLVRSIPSVSIAAGEPVTAELMRAGRERSLDVQRKTITVIGSLSAVATSLAAAGMFALMAFAVAQRRRELGIRIAIGAGPRQVLRTLLAQNVAPVTIGAVAGTLLGIVADRLVRSVVPIPGGSPLSAVDVALGLGAFVLIAALATASPAAKALRIDPSSTLRCE